jgi:hypothetical protein
MKEKTLLLLLACSFGLQAQYLTKVDSMQVSQAQIWGVTGDDGDSLSLTTTFSSAGQPHIWLRKVNYSNIQGQGTLRQITTGADYANGRDLTDHKHIVFNNNIYVSFSTQGDQELFLFKTDMNGNRVGSLVTVFQGAGMPTNDMMLATDSTYIYVLHFAPPSQSRVYKYDTNLNPVGSAFTTTTLLHNNLGNVVHQNGHFYMYTGSQFGFNSNLVLTEWTSAFAPQGSSAQTLIPSAGGDGNFFATGVAYDPATQLWFVGFNHINSGQTIGQEHLDIAVFDASFNLLERKHTTGNGFFRPHFVVKGNYLYVSYDNGGGSVYLLQYQISGSTGVIDLADEALTVYPNPATENLRFSEACERIELSNALGKVLVTAEGAGTIDIRNLPAGVYTCRIVHEGRTVFRKIVKN